MSLVISITHPEAIIMASDTKIITQIQEHKEIKGELVPVGDKQSEISQQDKTVEIPQVGVITFWGEATNTRTQLFKFISDFFSKGDDIDDVADKLFDYLKKEIRPERDVSMGFHLGGYNRDGKRRLYHIFHSVQNGLERNGIDFYKNLHDGGDKCLMLFNGKNKYTADTMMLFKELEERGYLVSPSKHSVNENVDLAQALINHTARIIREYEGTQSVGGAVNIYFIYPANKIMRQRKICRGEFLSYIRPSGDSFSTGPLSTAPDHPYP